MEESWDTAVAVATGELNAQEAFVRGQILLCGDQQRLLDSQPVFGALDAVFTTSASAPSTVTGDAGDARGPGPRRAAHRRFAGLRLKRFGPFTFTALKTAVPAPDKAYGSRSAVGRRGKYLLIEFEPVTFVVHLMQGGRLVVDEKKSAKPRAGQARFVFELRGAAPTGAAAHRTGLGAQGRRVVRADGERAHARRSTRSGRRRDIDPDEWRRVSPRGEHAAARVPPRPARHRRPRPPARQRGVLPSQAVAVRDDRRLEPDAARRSSPRSATPSPRTREERERRHELVEGAPVEGPWPHRTTVPGLRRHHPRGRVRQLHGQLLPDVPDGRQGPRRQHDEQVPQVARASRTVSPAGETGTLGSLFGEWMATADATVGWSGRCYRAPRGRVDPSRDMVSAQPTAAEGTGPLPASVIVATAATSAATMVVGWINIGRSYSYDEARHLRLVRAWRLAVEGADHAVGVQQPSDVLGDPGGRMADRSGRRDIAAAAPGDVWRRSGGLAHLVGWPAYGCASPAPSPGWCCSPTRSSFKSSARCAATRATLAVLVTAIATERSWRDRRARWLVVATIANGDRGDDPHVQRAPRS